MESQVPFDPATALEQIRRQHERVVEAVVVPPWYWWSIAALTIGLCAVVDVGQTLWTTAAIAAYVALVVLLSGMFVFGIGRQVRVHSEMLGNRGAVSIVRFVWLAVGLSLAVGFVLQFSGFDHPALAAGIIAALVLAVGGPALMNRVRRLMLTNVDATPDD